jgi:hypothetical protein
MSNRFKKALRLGSCIFLLIAGLQMKAAAKNYPSFPIRSLATDSVSLKTIDSLVVDPGYTIFRLADTTTLRFHFTVKTPGGSIFNSGNLPSDFIISAGFIAFFDADRIAMLLIDKLKAGETQPRITTDDLSKNGIPQQ